MVPLGEKCAFSGYTCCVPQVWGVSGRCALGVRVFCFSVFRFLSAARPRRRTFQRNNEEVFDHSFAETEFASRTRSTIPGLPEIVSCFPSVLERNRGADCVQGGDEVGVVRNTTWYVDTYTYLVSNQGFLQ